MLGLVKEDWTKDRRNMKEVDTLDETLCRNSGMTGAKGRTVKPARSASICLNVELKLT